MNDDAIGKLLRTADAQSPGPSPVGGDLASRIRRIARRRRAMRSAALAAVLLISAGAAVYITRPATPTAGPTNIRAEMAALELEIQLHRAMVAYMLEIEEDHQLAEQIKAAEMSDPQDDLRRQVERAAYAMMLLGDRQEKRFGDTIAAAETYRQVIAQFGQSHWAQIARDRLANLKNKSSARPTAQYRKFTNVIDRLANRTA